jgi:dihydrofolate reductase
MARSRQRRFIAYLAISADGFISRSDGSVDWLDRPSTPGHYGMLQFYRTVDTVVMGRATWDFAVAHGQPRFEGKINYVLTNRKPRRRYDGVTFVSGDVKPLIQELRAQRGKHVWIVGGAEVFGQFLDAGAIDEFILHVIPTLIGEGIPLVSPKRRTVPMTLASSKRYADGVVRLRYVLPAASASPSGSKASRRKR